MTIEEAELRIKTKLPRSSRSSKRVMEASGNVFADLGLPNADQELLKARLTLQIYRIVKQRGLTQTQAAKALGVKQPHVSLLMRNRAGTFSIGRLIDFLTALGQDVEITVRPTRKEHGEMSVALF
jgi:predicted XRE-type DNA-binding protein